MTGRNSKPRFAIISVCLARLYHFSNSFLPTSRVTRVLSSKKERLQLGASADTCTVTLSNSRQNWNGNRPGAFRSSSFLRRQCVCERRMPRKSLLCLAVTQMLQSYKFREIREVSRAHFPYKSNVRPPVESLAKWTSDERKVIRKVCVAELIPRARARGIDSIPADGPFWRPRTGPGFR